MVVVYVLVEVVVSGLLSSGGVVVIDLNFDVVVFGID